MKNKGLGEPLQYSFIVVFRPAFSVLCNIPLCFTNYRRRTADVSDCAVPAMARAPIMDGICLDVAAAASLVLLLRNV